MLDANSKGNACLWMRWAGLYLQKGKFLQSFCILCWSLQKGRGGGAKLPSPPSPFPFQPSNRYRHVCARGIKKIKNNLFKQVYTPNFTGEKKGWRMLRIAGGIKYKIKTWYCKKKNQELFFFHLYQITRKLKSVASTMAEVRLGCKHEQPFNRG